MAKVRTRPDVGTLGTDADPWHPTLLAYAKAVGAMQALPLTDPRSWGYQAAIHGRNGSMPAGVRWNECQHATWYFLPWHRMYLAQFEAIIQAVLKEQFNGPADWSLPFWNYEAPGGNRLPPAFRAPKLPDGSPNPLYVTQRSSAVNQGGLFPSTVTSSVRALRTTTFTSTFQAVGFGGPRTSFAHQGPAFGALEAQPHGPIHVFINGWMGDPATAAQDPIFWLHHANIDRLWELWNRKAANETATSWTGRTFRLFAPNRSQVTMKVQDVLDIEGKMGYTYAGLPAKARRAGMRASASADKAPEAAASRGPRPELIGASGEATRLGGQTVRVGVPLTAPKPRQGRAAETPRRVMLDIGEITGATNPSMVYGVYVNRPDGAGDADEYLAGVVSTFGIVQASNDGGGLRFTFDITELADRLADEDRWDPAHLDVDFEPISPEDITDHIPITVGSVRVYVR